MNVISSIWRRVSNHGLMHINLSKFVKLKVRQTINIIAFCKFILLLFIFSPIIISLILFCSKSLLTVASDLNDQEGTEEENSLIMRHINYGKFMH